MVTNTAPLRQSIYELPEYVNRMDTNGKAEGTAERIYADLASYLRTVSNETFSLRPLKGADSVRTVVGNLVSDCLTVQDLDSTIDNLFAQAYQQAMLYVA